MTSNIIYHDFTNSTADCGMSVASPLPKASRILHRIRRANEAVHTACIFLCGACVGVSLLILVNLLAVI